MNETRYVIHCEQTTAVIPSGIVNLADFRAWAHAGGLSQRGRYSFLNGTVWVDLTREEIITHNFVKREVFATLFRLNKAEKMGYVFPSGALLSNLVGNFSTEPDAMLCSYKSLDAGPWVIASSQ